MKWIRFTYCLLIGLAVVSTEIRSQALSRLVDDNGGVHFDYAAFAGDSAGTIRLELYYQVANAALEFQPTEGRFRAEYDITVTVRDDDDYMVDSHKEDKSLTVGSLEKTRSRSDYRTNQLDFQLLPGKYEILFVLADKHSQAIVRRDLEVKLNPFENKQPRLSDVELAQAVGPRDDQTGIFAKGDMSVVPSLTRRFGSGPTGRLMFYVEVYRGLDSVDHVTVETMLRHDRKGMVYRDTLHTNLDTPTIRQLREISLAELPPGPYELYVRLRGRRYKKIDEKKTQFEVMWTEAALLRHDYRTAVMQLEYIADPAEIKKLENIEGPAEQVAAFRDFWAKHDPDPTTPINELKIRFYHRINIANRLFTVMRVEGWRTDRGRILIQYGEPDQIDDYPFSANFRPRQHWHYYRRGPYRKFTFVDENEDGDYRLQYPYDGLGQRPDF